MEPIQTVFAPAPVVAMPAGAAALQSAEIPYSAYRQGGGVGGAGQVSGRQKAWRLMAGLYSIHAVLRQIDFRGFMFGGTSVSALPAIAPMMASTIAISTSV